MNPAESNTHTRAHTHTHTHTHTQTTPQKLCETCICLHTMRHALLLTSRIFTKTIKRAHTHTHKHTYECSSHSLPAPLAACQHRVGVPRYGQVQMALSRLSPNRISQNTPVTAETCAPSQSGAATETNYHQQSSRRRVHEATPCRHLTRLPRPGDKSAVSLACAAPNERETHRQHANC